MNLNSPSDARSKILLPLLLLVLLMTQAASTVCGAQCAQHQIPNPPDHTIGHCHSMPQPESNGPALQTCQTGAHAICAIDLLGNTGEKNATQLASHADVRAGNIRPGQNIPQFLSRSHLPRSSADPAPLITALRV